MTDKRLIDIQRELILAQSDYEGMDEQQYLEQVEQLTRELYDKEDAVARYYKHLEYEIERAKEAKRKLDNYIKVQSNACERLKQYVIHTYEELGELPNYSDFNPIAISETPGSVDVYDPHALPQHFWRRKIIEEPNKNKILKELREGKRIKGARLEKKPMVRGLK